MRFALTILLMAGLQASVVAQTSMSERNSAVSEIRGLTEKWYKAAMQKDSATLGKILAAGFSLNGDVSRSVWMDRTLNHIKTDTLQNVGKVSLRYYGGAVVSKGTVRWKAMYDGKDDLTGNYPFEDIWVKVDGQWRVLIRLSDRAN
jgi:Domain of unknown function (DUF4440)